MTVDERLHDRQFVRTFFTTPTAVEGEDDSAKMLKSAIGLRGMQAPDVWVPDNEDATAPNMRDEGAGNIIDVVAADGAVASSLSGTQTSGACIPRSPMAL